MSSQIREDKVYIRNRKSLRQITEQIDPERLINELMGLHASRGITALRPKTLLQSASYKITEASLDEISTRSRATTIKMEALRALLTIEEVYDHLRKYLLVKYSNSMKEQGKRTVTDKKNAIDVYLKSFIEFKKRLNSVCSIADLVIADVDAAGWSMKRITDALEQSSKDR